MSEFFRILSALKAFLIAGTLFASLYLPSVSAADASINDLIRQAQNLEASINATIQGYSDINYGISNRIVTEHIILARAKMADRKYADAVELLLQPALSDRFANHPGRSEAIMLLASALIREGYIRLARHYAAFVMDSKKGGEAVQQYAAAVWLDASIQLKQFDNIEGVEGAFAIRKEALESELNGARAELTYQYARALVIQKRFQEAIPYLASISPESVTAPKAKFALATALALTGKLDAAYALFYELSDPRNLNEELSPADRNDIANAANLARARIANEKNEFKKSWDGYSVITKDSPYYLDAVYETIWLYEGRGWFDESRNSLSAYLQLLPPTKRSQWTYILPGILLQRAGEYDKAHSYFDELAEKMSHIEGELIAEAGPIPNFIAKLSADIVEKGDKALEEQPSITGVLPGIEVITKASLTLHNIKSLEKEQRELREDYDKLITVIAGRTPPPIHEIKHGFGFLDTLKMKLFNIRQKFYSLYPEQGGSKITLPAGSGGDAYSNYPPSAARSLAAYLSSLDKKLAEFEKDIRRREYLISREITKALEEERNNIASYQSEIRSLRGKLETLITETSAYAVSNITARQHDMFMRAEFGKTETSWYAKESLSKRADALYEAKSNALKRLADTFGEDLNSQEIIYEETPPRLDASPAAASPTERNFSRLTPIIETNPKTPPILSE
ncbi:MAG: hypothetical protein Kow0090_18840 [Myxococcota bacterium]